MSEAIRASGLSVRFGDYTALDGVTVEAPDGAFVALLGPNGGGKTSFLKCCLGLIKPSEGSISIFGSEPSSTAPDLIGYVPQIKTLDRSFPAQALELVATGLRGSWPTRLTGSEREQVMKALDGAAVGHLAERPLSRLSGGELQRVYLARGLIRRPRLVLLDEPATGIDPVGEQDMFRSLETYRHETGAAIVMITHDWHTAVHHASHIMAVNRKLIGFGERSSELAEQLLREAFGHLGHHHADYV